MNGDHGALVIIGRQATLTHCGRGRLVATLLDEYTEYQRLRGWSPATIRRRTTTLTCFGRAIAPRRLEEATDDDVATYLGQFAAPRTRHSYRSDLRSFYLWAIRRHKVDHDPTELVDAIKVPRSLPRPISAGAVAKVTEASNDDVRLMVALALYAGLRCCEIARLEVGDVSERSLVVRGGKGGKDRQVPLHPSLLGMLARASEGRTGRLFDLSPDAVGRRVKRHMQACGVQATAHQLRHTFGTELARVSHGDLLMIGALMGHASATTTLGYTQLAGDKGAAAVSGMFGDAA